MRTDRHLRRGTAGLLAGLALVAAAASPTTAESVTYSLDKNPYVRTVKISNGASDVSVRIAAKRTPKSVTFRQWDVSLDTVADQSTDSGWAGEFLAEGPWRGSRAKLFVSAADDSLTRVTCDGLQTERVARLKSIVVPRSCLTYGDTEATDVRVVAGVFGDRVRKSGTGCWGVSAPRRGWTDWLQPGATKTASAKQSSLPPGALARGC